MRFASSPGKMLWRAALLFSLISFSVAGSVAHADDTYIDLREIVRHLGEDSESLRAVLTESELKQFHRASYSGFLVITGDISDERLEPNNEFLGSASDMPFATYDLRLSNTDRTFEFETDKSIQKNSLKSTFFQHFKRAVWNQLHAAQKEALIFHLIAVNIRRDHTALPVESKGEFELTKIFFARRLEFWKRKAIPFDFCDLKVIERKTGAIHLNQQIRPIQEVDFDLPIARNFHLSLSIPLAHDGSFSLNQSKTKIYRTFTGEVFLSAYSQLIPGDLEFETQLNQHANLNLRCQRKIAPVSKDARD